MTETATFVRTAFWNHTASIQVGPNSFNASDKSDLLNLQICLEFWLLWIGIYLWFGNWN